MNHRSGLNGTTRPKERGRTFLLIFGLLATVTFFTACAYTYFVLGTEKQAVFKTPSAFLRDGWTDDAGNPLTLPAKLAYPESGSYSMRAIVPEMGLSDQNISLLFSAKYFNVTLFLDNEPIGTCFSKPEGAEKIVGKVFLFVPLPGDIVGKELRIEATPFLGDDMEYEIDAPQFGTGERLVYDLIRSDLPMLIILEAIFVFGILLLMFTWQARKTGNRTFFQTGLFAILFAMYSLVITDTIHLFLANSQFIYVVEFLLLALCPLPLLVLVYHVCLPKFGPYLLGNIGVLTLNFCFQTAVYFFTDLELRDIVWVTHALLVLSLFVLIPTLALSGRQGGERFRLLVSFAPVLLGGAWDIGRFYLPGTYQKAVGFQLGALLFISLQTVYLVHSYLESDLYRKMAYTDALTGLENRTAFEERIVQLGKTASHYASIWCVCADVNFLKKVNDTLGHSAGDELIRSAAKVLREVKEKDSDLYRTGGDEFVLFEYNQSEEAMKQRLLRFEAALSRYNQIRDVPLSIALGYDRLSKGDTLIQLISRTDSVMYEDKRRQKEQLLNSESEQ